MGAACVKHRQYDKVSVTGNINIEKLKTGDLVFFSNNWSKSKVRRKIRAVNDRLWATGGVVINAPELFGGEPMLLEYQKKYPDDMLQNQLTLQQSKSGVRLVSLVGRLKQPNYQACLIRKLHPDPAAKISRNQARTCAAMIHGIRDTTYASPAHMIFNSLHNTGLLKRDIKKVGTTLSECTSSILDEHTITPGLYSKGKIYQLNP